MIDVLNALSMGNVLSGMINFMNDPVPSFYFGVLIMDSGSWKSGLSIAQSVFDPVASAFTEVSGLEIGLDSGAVTWEEGGNSVPVKLPGRLKNDVINLKRYLRPRHVASSGFTDPLGRWTQKTFEAAHTWTDRIEVKDVMIMVYHPQIKPVNVPVALYKVIGAYPTKWTMSDLSSTNESDPITETFELTYRDLKRLTIPTPI